MVAVNYVPCWNRLLDIGWVAWLSLFIIEEKLSLFDLSNQNLVFNVSTSWKCHFHYINFIGFSTSGPSFSV